MKPRKPVNLRGLISGRLVVVGLSQIRKSRNYYWRCVCRCGNRRDVRATLLIGRKTKSCGCLARESTSTRNRKHGKGSTPEAAIWRAMIARCHNPKSTAYHWYGTRGICVCQRWRDSFENFLEDIGPFPTGMDLDRINNDGDYEPSNCRFVPTKVNCRNRRNNRLIAMGGETKTMAEWAEITGINAGTLWKRLRSGWSPEKTLTTAIRSRATA